MHMHSCFIYQYEPEQFTGLHYRLPIDSSLPLSSSHPPPLPVQLTQAGREARTKALKMQEDLDNGQFVQLSKSTGLNYFNPLLDTRTQKAILSAAKKSGEYNNSMGGRLLTCTVFANGKVTFTGVKHELSIYLGYIRLFYLLRPFAVAPLPPPISPAMPAIATATVYRTGSEAGVQNTSTPSTPQVLLPPVRYGGRIYTDAELNRLMECTLNRRMAENGSGEAKESGGGVKREGNQNQYHTVKTEGHASASTSLFSSSPSTLPLSTAHTTPYDNSIISPMIALHAQQVAATPAAHSVTTDSAVASSPLSSPSSSSISILTKLEPNLATASTDHGMTAVNARGEEDIEWEGAQ